MKNPQKDTVGIQKIEFIASIVSTITIASKETTETTD